MAHASHRRSYLTAALLVGFSCGGGAAERDADDELPAELGDLWLDTEVPVRAVRLDAEGRLVVGGGASVARYTARGLDPSFGTQGVVTMDASTFLDTVLHQSVFDLELGADGAIYIAGTARYRPIGELDGDKMSVTKLLATGARDPNFGQSTAIDGAYQVAGRTTSQMHSEFSALALREDGSLLVVGTKANTQRVHTDLITVALTAGGEAEAAFGTRAVGYSSSDFEGVRVLALSDGRVLAAGFRDSSYADGPVLARYLATGAADSTFGTDGVLRDLPLFAESSGGTRLADVVARSDGSYVLVGGSVAEVDGSPERGWCAIGLSEAGALLASFGDGGVIWQQGFPATIRVSQALLDAEDRVLVVGTFTEAVGGMEHIVLFGLDASGALDTSWGAQGYVTVPIEGTGTRVHAQASGADLLLLGGTSTASGSKVFTRVVTR